MQDKLNEIAIKGMGELTSDISKFIERQSKPIEFIILDKDGSPQIVKLTTH